MSTTRLERLVPATVWLRTYGRDDLTADLKAGATVGVLVIPQAMAYAALAGVPPIAGLYAAMVSLVVYAVFGTSRFISVGPVAIDSLLTAVAVAPLADGDPVRYAALASLVAVLVGVMQTGAGLLRLGELVNFISVPVIAGFTSAAALTIAVSQLKDLLGVSLDRPANTFIEVIRGLSPLLTDANLTALAVGVVTIAALVAVKRWLPRLPGPLLVLTLVTAVVWLSGLGDRISLVGEVPAGLPTPALPAVGWGDVRLLLPSAAAIALVSYLESISTGQVFARRTRTRVDPDAELVAVGLANAAAGLMRGFPVAGGFSRGAVNFNAGARSPMSGVVASVLVVVALFVATPLLALLPKVALAAIIVVAVVQLIDVRGAVAIGRIRRSDLVALLVTAAVTLALGPVPGLGAGVALSFVLFLRHMARPHIAELGWKADDNAYRNVDRYDVQTDPRLLVLRVDAPLSFASARPIAARIEGLVRRRPDLQWLVFDGSAINTADYTGIDMLRTLTEDLAGLGIEVHLAAMRGPVRDVVGREPHFRAMEEQGRIHQTVALAVAGLPVSLDDDRP